MPPVACAAAAGDQARLVISGAFHTTSARVDAIGHACGFRTKTRTLIYQSDALRIGHGPAVARIEFSIPHFRGRGRYDARLPAPYGRTAVQIVTAQNATTGVGGGFYLATSGGVAVSDAKNVGRPGRVGSVSGAVHARLRVRHGTKQLHLDGNWHCRIDAAANG